MFHSPPTYRTGFSTRRRIASSAARYSDLVITEKPLAASSRKSLVSSQLPEPRDWRANQTLQYLVRPSGFPCVPTRTVTPCRSVSESPRPRPTTANRLLVHETPE